MKPINLTIAMPTYNRAELLRENIGSLLKSKHDFELLIIDDGSTDDTESVVKSFSDPRITYYRHSVNCGYAKSLNDGIERAKNSQIFLCEDDAFILNPDKFFEILISEMDHRTIVATHLLVNGKETKPNLVKRLKRYFAAPLAKEVYCYNGHKRRTVKFCNNCFGFNRDKITTRFEESDYIGNFFRIESDFQIRALKKGANIVYNPKLVIDHRRYVSGGLRVRDVDTFFYQCMVNHITFLRRHYLTWNIYMNLLLKLLTHPTKWSIVKKALKAYMKLQPTKSIHTTKPYLSASEVSL